MGKVAARCETLLVSSGLVNQTKVNTSGRKPSEIELNAFNIICAAFVPAERAPVTRFISAPL